METTINRVDIRFIIVEQCSVKWGYGDGATKLSNLSDR